MSAETHQLGRGADIANVAALFGDADADDSAATSRFLAELGDAAGVADLWAVACKEFRRTPPRTGDRPQCARSTHNGRDRGGDDGELTEGRERR